MAIRRVVRPELLDELPASDPAAQRSRRDLRRINAMMGNFRWVTEAIAPFVGERSRIVEIGAGEGLLLYRLARKFPQASLEGVDRAPRPEGLASQISWNQRDIFEGLQGDVAIGVMVAHHFTDEKLAELAPLLRRFRVICLCEPWRSSLARLWGRLLLPFVGDVTRHDMLVSIDAGFDRGELIRLLELDEWAVRETIDWRGSCRLLAWR